METRELCCQPTYKVCITNYTRVHNIHNTLLRIADGQILICGCQVARFDLFVFAELGNTVDVCVCVPDVRCTLATAVGIVN